MREVEREKEKKKEEEEEGWMYGEMEGWTKENFRFTFQILKSR